MWCPCPMRRPRSCRRSSARAVERAVGKGGKQIVRRRRGSRVSGIIEVEIDGVTVRVGCGADAKTVAAVIRALKAGT